MEQVYIRPLCVFTLCVVTLEVKTSCRWRWIFGKQEGIERRSSWKIWRRSCPCLFSTTRTVRSAAFLCWLNRIWMKPQSSMASKMWQTESTDWHTVFAQHQKSSDWLCVACRKLIMPACSDEIWWKWGTKGNNIVLFSTLQFSAFYKQYFKL